MSKFTRVLIILSIFLLVIGGSSIAQDETILVVGHAESTDSLDPARGFTGTTGIVNKATYETLVTFPDEDASSIQPLLATDWSVSDDGLVYTFNLRDDVVFNDGSPMTASDVVFSFNRLINVKGNPSFLAENIAGVEAIDDYTVAISLYNVNPSFLAELPNYAFSISSEAIITANGGTSGEDAAETDLAEEFLNSSSAGSGPYILESWEPLVETVLVRNPNYWGEQPYFDRIIIANIAEAATQLVALQSGDIDLALDLSADQISTLEGAENITIYSGPSVTTHFLLMNADPEIGGPVSDPLVQKAIRLSLDYDGYITLWGGLEPVGNLAIGMPGALSEDQAITPDLDAARDLLAQAGYPEGFDITLSYPDFSWQGVDMNINAQKIQSDLAEVGINVTLNPGELGVSLDEYRNGLQGFAYWFWGPDKLDMVDLLSFLPGGKVASERANWDLEDVDPEIQAMIQQAAVETNDEARTQLYAELQLWMQESGAFAPFNQPDIQSAFASDIEGYIWHPQWAVDLALLSRSE